MVDAGTPPELPPGLREEYLAGMRSQLGLLTTIADRLTAAGNDREALAMLQGETHKIHGSAGSYGFAQASRLAAGLEATAKDWVARPDDPEVDRGSLLHWFVGRLAEMLGITVSRAAAPAPPPAAPPRAPLPRVGSPPRPSRAQPAPPQPAPAPSPGRLPSVWRPPRPGAPSGDRAPAKPSAPVAPPRQRPPAPPKVSPPRRPDASPGPPPSPPSPPPPPLPALPPLKPPPVASAEPEPAAGASELPWIIPPEPPAAEPTRVKPEPEREAPAAAPPLLAPEPPTETPPVPPAAIEVPVPEPMPATAPAIEPTNVPELIVVEDDASLAELLAYGLQARGYRFRAYRNGRDALRELIALDVQGTHPLVLLDVDLPGLDGYSVLDALQRARPGTYRVVFTTVHGTEEEQLRGLEAGALDYLLKPISLRVALEKIRRWVGR